ncbi:biotin/lipoyl-binding protein, partial [Erwinia persicina]
MLFIKRRTNPAAKLAKRQYARVYNINLPGLKLALMMFALFFLCLIIYCCVVEYSETTLAQGVVINAKGDVQVRAKASGTIMNIPIKEGQYVKANQILFSLSRDYGGKEGSVIEYEAAHYLSEIKRNNDRMRNMTSSVDNLKRNLTRQLAII